MLSRRKPLLVLIVCLDLPSGLVPSAVLNVEMITRGGNRLWQTSAGSDAAATGTPARSAAGGAAESWPSWIIRLGLSAIMLPFRLIQNMLAPPQTYEPLPQAAAVVARGTAGEPAHSRARPPRQERQVEFYNGMFLAGVEIFGG
jgi:hypothetical protein